MTVELGSVLLGLVAIFGFVADSWRRSRRAERKVAASDAGRLAEQYRKELAGLMSRWEGVIEHWEEERAGWIEARAELERVAQRERMRADDAEIENAKLHGQIVSFRIDLAHANQQIAELRSRVERLAEQGDHH